MTHHEEDVIVIYIKHISDKSLNKRNFTVQVGGMTHSLLRIIATIKKSCFYKGVRSILAKQIPKI